MRLRLKLLVTAFAFAACSAMSAQGGLAARKAAPACGSVSPQTCATAQALGRGINLGNMFDAPREGDWGVRFDPGYVEKIAGRFDTVRLPVRWSNHADSTAQARLDEVFAQRVDKAIDALLAKGLYVILNMHHYSQIHGSALHPNEAPVDAAVVDARLVNIWRQLAVRYKDRSPRLLFELLNEPHGKLSGDAWNELSARTLAAVRATNPTRVVLIGPGEWNNVSELPRLKLPPDRNLIVAIHNYDPFPFTHQGVDHLAKPFPVGTRCCDPSQRKSLVDALDVAQRWSQASGYPLHLGEFGAHEKADMKSREAYTRMVRDEAERRGISWAYWEFASSFGVYSPANGAWVEPIRRALLD